MKSSRIESNDLLKMGFIDPGVRSFLFDRACQVTPEAQFFLRNICAVIATITDDQQRNSCKDALAKKANEYETLQSNLQALVNESKQGSKQLQMDHPRDMNVFNDIVITAMIYGIAKDVLDKASRLKPTEVSKLFKP